MADGGYLPVPDHAFRHSYVSLCTQHCKAIELVFRTCRLSLIKLIILLSESKVQILLAARGQVTAGGVFFHCITCTAECYATGFCQWHRPTYADSRLLVNEVTVSRTMPLTECRIQQDEISSHSRILFASLNRMHGPKRDTETTKYSDIFLNAHISKPIY